MSSSQLAEGSGVDSRNNHTNKRSIFQSPQHRHRVLRDALDCTSSLQLNATVGALKTLEVAVNKADDAHSNIDDRITHQDQILLDSQVMKVSSHVIKECMQSLTKQNNPYNGAEFAQNLTNFMNQLPDETGRSSAWQLLGKEAAPLVKICGDHFNLLHCMELCRPKTDTRKLEDAETLLRKKNEKKVLRQRDTLAPAKRPEQISTIANDDNPVDKSVDKVSHLIRKYCKRNTEPLNFFQLIIDPRDFGKTVENQLHVAFLLRDGKMALKVGDDGDLFIEPVPKPQMQNEENNEQHVIRIPNVPALTMKKWKIIIEALNITEPMIDWQ